MFSSLHQRFLKGSVCSHDALLTGRRNSMDKLSNEHKPIQLFKDLVYDLNFWHGFVEYTFLIGQLRHSTVCIMSVQQTIAMDYVLSGSNEII